MNLSFQYEKKNRENIENKAKVDTLSFDIEVLQNKVTVISLLIQDLKTQIKQSSTVNNVSETADSSKEELIQSLKKEIK